MAALSAAVRGRPSSTVKANRPPGSRADATCAGGPALSAKASIVSSRRTTSNGPPGSGGTAPTSNRQGRPAARVARDLHRVLVAVDAEVAAPQLGRDEASGTGHAAAQVEHGDARPDPGPARQRRGSRRPVMKLSCPTNSSAAPSAAYAAVRVRRSASSYVVRGTAVTASVPRAAEAPGAAWTASPGTRSCRSCRWSRWPAAPQPRDVAPEGLGQQQEADRQGGEDAAAGPDVGRGERQGDARHRRHDLAPVARRQARPHPGKHPAGHREHVARRPHREHPGAVRPGDVRR